MHLKQESHKVPYMFKNRNSGIYKVHFLINSHSQESVVGKGTKSIFTNEHLT